MALPPRIAILGATSIAHGKRLVDDLLTVEALAGGTVVLMAPNEARLGMILRYARRASADRGGHLNFLSATERESAIDGADYVIALFDSGGFQAYDEDFGIAARYGLDVCIGDSSGPTGIMKGLRNALLMEDACRDIGTRAPGAFLLSYANPMDVCIAVSGELLPTGRYVGLCGGVEATRRSIALCLGERPEELEMDFAGINHMCWTLAIRKNGVDLYPEFREHSTHCPNMAEERVRLELMQQFGYFASESSGHLSDFFPWFRSNETRRARYCRVSGYAGASGAYRKLGSFLQRRLGDEDYLEYETSSNAGRSLDYGASILEALETGTAYACYGNVMNEAGQIPNLARDFCVEIPVLVDSSGIRGLPQAPLPPQLAAFNAATATVHRLVYQAAREGDPELVVAAMALDPLTAAVLDLPTIRRLSRELLEANATYLPRFAGRRLRETVELPMAPPTLRAGGDDELFNLVRRFERHRRERSGDPRPADPERNPG